jgi:hypothetical protein
MACRTTVKAWIADLEQVLPACYLIWRPAHR